MLINQNDSLIYSLEQISKELKVDINNYELLIRLIESENDLYNFYNKLQIQIPLRYGKKLIYQQLKQNVYDDIRKSLRPSIEAMEFENFFMLINAQHVSKFKDFILKTWKFIEGSNKYKIMQLLDRNSQDLLQFENSLAIFKDQELQQTLHNLAQYSKQRSDMIKQIFIDEIIISKNQIDVSQGNYHFFKKIQKRLFSDPYQKVEDAFQSIKVFVAFQNKKKYEMIYQKLIQNRCQQIFKYRISKYHEKILKDITNKIMEKIAKQFRSNKLAYYLIEKEKVFKYLKNFKLEQKQDVKAFLCKEPTKQDIQDKLQKQKEKISYQLQLFNDDIMIQNSDLYNEMFNFLLQRFICILNQEQQVIYREKILFENKTILPQMNLQYIPSEQLNSFICLFIQKSFSNIQDLPSFMISTGFKKIFNLLEHFRENFSDHPNFLQTHILGQILPQQNIQVIDQILKSNIQFQYFQDMKLKEKYDFLLEFISIIKYNVSLDMFLYIVEGLKYFINSLQSIQYIYRLWFSLLKIGNKDQCLDIKNVQNIKEILKNNQFHHLLQFENLSYQVSNSTREMFFSISGFLSEHLDKDKEWKSISQNFPFIEHLSLCWQSYSKSQFVQEMFKTGDIQGFSFGQLFTNTKNLIINNNQFLRSYEIAVTTGNQLGHLSLNYNLFNNRHINLISYSLGTVVAYQYALKLSEKSNQNFFIKNVILLGSCVKKEQFEKTVWKIIGSKNLLSGSIYIITSNNDTVLQYLFQMATLSQAIGFNGCNLKRVTKTLQQNDHYFKNWTYLETMDYVKKKIKIVNLTDVIKNHFTYLPKLTYILKQIDIFKNFDYLS